MNIFLTDPSPKLSALALDDKRVVKMALETAQLLSSALRLTLPFGLAHPSLYRSTHINHPCAVWTRADLRNFVWMVEHGIALTDEYKFRFGRHHKSRDVIDLAFNHLSVYGDCFPGLSSEIEFTFDSSGQSRGDVFTNYRHCLINKWLNLDTRRPVWTYRGKPLWYQQVKEDFGGS